MNTDFYINGFVRLPWHLISDILHDLPRDYIYKAFINVPGLREQIVDEFLREVGFVLREEPTYDAWTSSIQHFKLEDIGEVTSFLKTNHDVIPEKASVFVYNLTYFRDLFNRFRDYFLQVSDLRIHFVESDLVFNDELLKFLYAFPNIRTLEMKQPRLDDVSDMASAFTRFENVETLSVVDHSIDDWTSIVLPQQLKKLMLYPGLLQTVKVPPKVESLRWISEYRYELELSKIVFPPTLTTLSIEHNRSLTWKIAELPRTLKHLTIKHCLLTAYHWQGDVEEEWPAGLEYLDLSDSMINDETLSLFASGLPSGLHTLNLASNKFNELSRLKPVPSALKNLNLSEMPGLSLLDIRDGDVLDFYHFPESLETLDLSGSSRGLRSLTGRALERIKLPGSLRELTLDDVPYMFLNIYALPTSLTRLSMSNMGIKELLAFESTQTSNEAVADPFLWRELEHLSFLELSSNEITSLDGWKPPPNINTLYLEYNYIERLSSRWPLFNKDQSGRLKSLRFLDLKGNKISDIDQDLWLPPKLRFFGLEGNKLTSFPFTEGMMNGLLNVVDLQDNAIRSVQALTNKQAFIRALDLSCTEQDGSDEEHTGGDGNEKESMASLYREFKKMGLEPSGVKAHSLRDLHLFKPI